MKKKELCVVHFGNGVAPLKMRKGGSDQRKEVSFRRPIFGL